MAKWMQPHVGRHYCHITALNDLTDNVKPDVLAITETWIRATTTTAELIDSTPPGYFLFSAPRTSASHPSKTTSGGDTAFLVKEPATILKLHCPFLLLFWIFLNHTKNHQNTFDYLQHLPPTASISTLSTFFHLSQSIFVFSFQRRHNPPLTSSSAVTSTFTLMILLTHNPSTFPTFSISPILYNIYTSLHTNKVIPSISS